jgi:hypothetical protein
MGIFTNVLWRTVELYIFMYCIVYVSLLKRIPDYYEESSIADGRILLRVLQIV